MTLTTLFAMGLDMTSAPIVQTLQLTSFGKYTVTPRWPIGVEYLATSNDTEITDPGLAHISAARDFQKRRPRKFTLQHEEDWTGWVDVVSKWQTSGYGSRPLDFDVPGSSPTETIQVVFDGEPKLQTLQSSSTVYVFTVTLLELVHSYPEETVA